MEIDSRLSNQLAVCSTPFVCAPISPAQFLRFRAPLIQANPTQSAKSCSSGKSWLSPRLPHVISGKIRVARIIPEFVPQEAPASLPSPRPPFHCPASTRATQPLDKQRQASPSHSLQ